MLPNCLQKNLFKLFTYRICHLSYKFQLPAPKYLLLKPQMSLYHASCRINNYNFQVFLIENILCLTNLNLFIAQL